MNDDGMIRSPIGDIITKLKGGDHTKGRIEEVETERIFKCSELLLKMENKKEKRKVLEKLLWTCKPGESVYDIESFIGEG